MQEEGVALGSVPSWTRVLFPLHVMVHSRKIDLILRVAVIFDAESGLFQKVDHVLRNTHSVLPARLPAINNRCRHSTPAAINAMCLA